MAPSRRFLTFLVPCSFALVLPNDVGRLPALGWNSWNAYGCSINESSFLSAAQSMVSLGFKDAGYEYVNIDDCWSVPNVRNSFTKQIIPDPEKFPDGISGLASKIHDMGLKIGIYSSAGVATCAGYPASIGYESIDAATFSAWGIDYLKYDNCFVPAQWADDCNACVPDSVDGGPYINGTCTTESGPPNLCPADYDYSQSNTARRYAIMRDALLAQNRTILYSLCEWGQADVEQWANSTASSWRISGDITADFSRILEIININSFHLSTPSFSSHNDADMLELGNGALTPAESRSHFALWAAMKSPLILGTDLSRLPEDTIQILLNKHILAFNQDGVYGAPATPYKWGVNPDWTFNASAPAAYWAGQSSNGTMVLMLNTLDVPQDMVAVYGEIPGLSEGATYRAIDVWAESDLGCFEGGLGTLVESHDTAVLLLQDTCP